MKNLIIFTVIICFITALMNFSEVNEKVDKAIQSDLMLSETFMKYNYNTNEIAKYQAEKKKLFLKLKLNYIHI